MNTFISELHKYENRNASTLRPGIDKIINRGFVFGETPRRIQRNGADIQPTCIGYTADCCTSVAVYPFTANVDVTFSRTNDDANNYFILLSKQIRFSK